MTTLTLELDDDPLPTWARVACVPRWELNYLSICAILSKDSCYIVVFVSSEDRGVALVYPLTVASGAYQLPIPYD